jgi:hypothetical protein
VAIKSLLQKIDMRAAIIFIAAHFVSTGIYNLLIVDGDFVISKGGFILHMLQASVYSSIIFLNFKFELSIAAGVTAIFYCLIAINWVFLERGIELDIQSFFYDSFSSIIMTINLIVIYLLGKDGAIHLFNMLLRRHTFLSRIQLFFRNSSDSSIHNVTLPFGDKDIKSKEICK